MINLILLIELIVKNQIASTKHHELHICRTDKCAMTLDSKEEKWIEKHFKNFGSITIIKSNHEM